jgi:hypothetical protein
MEVIFGTPKYLFYLLFVPIVIITHYLVLRISKKSAVPFANYEALSRISKKYIFTQNNHQLFVRVIAIVLVVFALAEMTFLYSSESTTPNTIILIDASNSMAYSDNNGESLRYAKDIAEAYASKQHMFSQVGVITFSTISKVIYPLQRMDPSVNLAISGLVPHNVGGTDVGTAIMNSIQMLIPLEGDKKVLVLTDGRASFGTALRDALSNAVMNQVVIDSVIIGTEETDEEGYSISAMKLIANMTEGKMHFAAGTPESIAKHITTYKEASVHLSLREYLLIAALVIITLEWALSKSIYKTIPHDN